MPPIRFHHRSLRFSSQDAATAAYERVAYAKTTIAQSAKLFLDADGVWVVEWHEKV